MSDKQKYQLKKLKLERELVDRLTKLALILGTVLLMALAIWRIF